MTNKLASVATLKNDIEDLGISAGDGLFVHASMRAVGPIIGGARSVVSALLSSVGPDGLIGMPGFTTDAYFPPNLDRTELSLESIKQIEGDVLGFDLKTSPTSGMGVIAETFRNWPETMRSTHPVASTCLNGRDASEYTSEHSLAWATGLDTPLGKLRMRKSMKILLIGVGWNRCSALHAAESLAEAKRTKIRRFKSGKGNAPWIETPDVADDLNRLFPLVGAAFEKTNSVSVGYIGGAVCKLCNYRSLVEFASDWISEANKQSGDQH